MAQRKYKRSPVSCDDIGELSERKQRLRQDVKTLNTAADKDAMKAECLYSIKYIYQANSLCCSR